MAAINQGKNIGHGTSRDTHDGKERAEPANQSSTVCQRASIVTAVSLGIQSIRRENPTVHNVSTDVNNAIYNVNKPSAERWSSRTADISAGETSARESTVDDSDGYELTGSRRKKRRLRIEQQNSGNSPAVNMSYASIVKLPSASAVGVKTSIDTVNGRLPSMRQSKKPLIVGKGSVIHGSTSDATVVAARQLKAVFRIDNVDCSVDETDLKEFVLHMGVRAISCFKVRPRLTDYQRQHNYSHNTFRLCINRADTKLLLQANKWPSDIIISRWVFSGKSDNGTVNTGTETSHANQSSHGDTHDPNLDLQTVETREIDMDETILVCDTVIKSPINGGVENNTTNENV
jgi:hypothetical protein